MLSCPLFCISKDRKAVIPDVRLFLDTFLMFSVTTALVSITNLAASEAYGVSQEGSQYTCLRKLSFVKV